MKQRVMPWLRLLLRSISGSARNGSKQDLFRYLASIVLVTASQASADHAAPLMPRVEDYTLMHWADGFPSSLRRPPGTG